MAKARVQRAASSSRSGSPRLSRAASATAMKSGSPTPSVAKMM